MADNKEAGEKADGRRGLRRGGARSSGEQWGAKKKLTGAGSGGEGRREGFEEASVMQRIEYGGMQ